MAASFRIDLWIDRKSTFDVQLFEADGETEVVLAEDDEVWFKVGRGSNPSLLDINSFNEDSGGSQVTFTTGTNDVCVAVAAADLPTTVETGAYDAEIVVVDQSDRELGESQPKHVQNGVVHLHNTLGSATEEESSGSSSESSNSSSSSS